MKRAAVIKKLKAEAKRRGLEFEEIALTRHDAYRVGKPPERSAGTARSTM